MHIGEERKEKQSSIEKRKDFTINNEKGRMNILYQKKTENKHFPSNSSSFLISNGGEEEIMRELIYIITIN